MSADQNPPVYFHSLELTPTSWTRWVGSLIFHAFLLALIVIIPWSVHEAVQPKQQTVVKLFEPVPPPAIPPPPQRIVPLRKIPPPPPVVEIVKVTPPAPRIVMPPVPVKQAPQKTVAVQEPPTQLPEQRQVAKLELPKIEVPAYQPPPKPVKMGGFGDTSGVVASPTQTNKTALAQVGSFDLPVGAQEGNGHAGRQVAVAGFGDSTKGVSNGTGKTGGAVARSGFGDATQGTGATPGSGHGLVQNAGFAAPETAPAAPRAARATAPAETPVQITFKPKPVYTPEAVEKKIEGEVLLEIMFSADGQIHVLRVMRGLGFGLDESARNAASQIRFQPGTRGGAPVDMKGTVHIVFALS